MTPPTSMVGAPMNIRIITTNLLNLCDIIRRSSNEGGSAELIKFMQGKALDMGRRGSCVNLCRSLSPFLRASSSPS